MLCLSIDDNIMDDYARKLEARSYAIMPLFHQYLKVYISHYEKVLIDKYNQRRDVQYVYGVLKLYAFQKSEQLKTINRETTLSALKDAVKNMNANNSIEADMCVIVPLFQEFYTFDEILVIYSHFYKQENIYAHKICSCIHRQLLVLLPKSDNEGVVSDCRLVDSFVHYLELANDPCNYYSQLDKFDLDVHLLFVKLYPDRYCGILINIIDKFYAISSSKFFSREMLLGVLRDLSWIVNKTSYQLDYDQYSDLVSSCSHQLLGDSDSSQELLTAHNDLFTILLSWARHSNESSFYQLHDYVNQLLRTEKKFFLLHILKNLLKSELSIKALIRVLCLSINDEMVDNYVEEIKNEFTPSYINYLKRYTELYERLLLERYRQQSDIMDAYSLLKLYVFKKSELHEKDTNQTINSALRAVIKNMNMNNDIESDIFFIDNILSDFYSFDEMLELFIHLRKRQDNYSNEISKFIYAKLLKFLKKSEPVQVINDRRRAIISLIYYFNLDDSPERYYNKLISYAPESYCEEVLNVGVKYLKHFRDEHFPNIFLSEILKCFSRTIMDKGHQIDLITYIDLLTQCTKQILYFLDHFDKSSLITDSALEQLFIILLSGALQPDKTIFSLLFDYTHKLSHSPCMDLLKDILTNMCHNIDSDKDFPKFVLKRVLCLFVNDAELRDLIDSQESKYNNSLAYQELIRNCVDDFEKCLVNKFELDPDLACAYDLLKLHAFKKSKSLKIARNNIKKGILKYCIDHINLRADIESDKYLILGAIEDFYSFEEMTKIYIEFCMFEAHHWKEICKSIYSKLLVLLQESHPLEISRRRRVIISLIYRFSLPDDAMKYYSQLMNEDNTIENHCNEMICVAAEYLCLFKNEALPVKLLLELFEISSIIINSVNNGYNLNKIYNLCVDPLGFDVINGMPTSQIESMLEAGFDKQRYNFVPNEDDTQGNSLANLEAHLLIVSNNQYRYSPSSC